MALATRSRLLALGLLAAVAVMWPVAPIHATHLHQEEWDDNVVVEITSPRPGDVLQGQVSITGYAFDRRSTDDSGINPRDVQLWLSDKADVRNLTSDARNLFDYADAGRESPTVAASYGSQFGRAGFSSLWETCGFPPGSYVLLVFASSLKTAGAQNVTSVNVEIAPCAPGQVLAQDDLSTHVSHAAQVRQPGDPVMWIYKPILADFAAGVDAHCARWVRLCLYGFNLRMLPGPGSERTNTTYAYYVDGPGARLGLFYTGPRDEDRSGPLTALVPLMSSPALHGGAETNRLAVIAQGDWLRLFVNGQQVAESHDRQRRWGQLAWAIADVEPVDMPLEVQFANLVITTPGPLETLGRVLNGP
jgi:hypothetical protein